METSPTVRWRHILVPTDFAACSDRALAMAGSLAQQHQASLTLLHVIALPVGLSLDTTIQPVELAEPYTIERYLSNPAYERMRQQIERVGGLPAVKTRVAFGSIAETVVKVVAELEVDLLVAGTHGRTGFARLAVGSVTERMLQSVPCPILIVRRSDYERRIAPGTEKESAVPRATQP